MAVNGELGNDPELLAASYFLGRLTEEEREQVRERLLADEDWVERFREVESDLAEQYVRGELTAVDQLAFERHFPRVEAVVFARRMQARRAVSRRWMLAAVPLAVAAVLVMALMLRGRPERAATEVRPQVVFAFGLAPGVTRGASGTPEIVIPREATTVEMQLGLEPPVEHLSFTVVVESRGKAVFSARNVAVRRPPAAPSVDAHIAAQVFAPGAYEVTLYGLRADGADELVGFYAFRVR